MEKVIITAALSGAVTPKEKNQAIPMTPWEIAEDAYACWRAGAAIVHLHMRNEQGIGCMDDERFDQTIKLIRAKKDCDVIINCTSSGDNTGKATDQDRMRHMKTVDNIEMGSYDAGSFNWMPGGVFINSPQFLQELGDVYINRNIKPEIEIFDSGMLGVTDYFVKEGHLPTPLHYQFCLGVLGAMPATVENLVYLVNKIPPGSTWSAFGVGRQHLPIMYAALALGGNIRVGLEDNIYFSKGVPATNVMLVERAVKAVEVFGKTAATPAEARRILGISQLR